MQYFVGHLIEGEAGTWHATITNDIAEKFDTWRIQDICPSHITLFSTFEAENSKVVEDVINAVLSDAHVGNYSIFEFDHFEDRAVFAKIRPDANVISLVQKLRGSLEQIPDIPEDKHPYWEPHATLAFRLPPEEITKIWNYVLTLKKPDFTASFDNIAIFRFENEKWIVEKVFRILNPKI